MRTFGIEEELLLTDLQSGYPAARADEISLVLQGSGEAGTPELLASQIESSTLVCTGLDEALEQLRRVRIRIADACDQAGLSAVPSGAAPRMPEASGEVSSLPRYQEMGRMAGYVAHEHYVNGTHVHVGVSGREEGVQALNGIRPWLATLGAVAANSPYWRDRDSSFSSWRMIHYRRWSVQGCPPAFLDAADYARRIQRLLETEVVLDTGHIGWAARLSERFPTIEVRVADAQLEARDAVLLAALVRGLVSTILTAAETGAAPAAPDDPELLDAALWQAGRYGLGGNLVRPGGGIRTAADQLAALLDYIRPALEDAGDVDFVRAGLDRMLAGGAGAERQRAAMAGGGPQALARLFARSLRAG